MKYRMYERAEWDSIDTEQWKSLADASIGINPFYEYWNLLPALKHFGDDTVKLITIESGDQIHALLPIVSTKNGAFSGLKSWKHRHCFVNTPLFRSPGALKRLITDALTHLKLGFFRLDQYGGNIEGISNGPYSTSVSCRPSQSLGISWDEFLSRHSKQRRKEYRRNLKKAEDNDFHHLESSPEDSGSLWLDDFMRLEAAGWKGANNSAIMCDGRVKQYYLDIIEEGWPLGKLQFQKISQSGSTVASSIRCLSRQHCYEIKVCFDEALRHLSPGVVLELHNLKSLFASNNVFADSCASPDNGVLSRMWLEQTPIRSTILFNSSLNGLLAKMIYGSWRSYKYRNQQA